MLYLTITYIFALTIINANCQCTPESVTPFINFMYFNGPSMSNFKIFSLADATSILQEPTYDPSLPLIFYLHGWSENALLCNELPDQSPAIVIPALLTQKINLVAVSYGPLVQKWSNETLAWPLNMAASYGLAVVNVTCMINPLQTFFNQFFSQCNCITKSQFIGFSIGAQISGLVAKGLSGKLQRIIGLDPAGPLFQLTPHLDASDATFVEIIHTDAGGFGFPVSCGSADFWPNQGIRAQPSCSLDAMSCSHYASTRYFANSISSQTLYEVKRCLLPGVCDPVVNMGYWTQTKATGNYFFTT